MILSNWRSYWRHITQPAASLQDQDQQQKAGLLASLSFVLLIVGSAIVTIWIIANPNFSAAPYISIGIIAILIIIYALSRTVHYRIGAFSLIIMLLLMVGTIYFTAPGSVTERMLAGYFLAIAILLASILLSIQITIYTAGLSIIAASLFFFVEEMPFAVAYTFLVFMLVISSLLVLATVIRNDSLKRLSDSEELFRQLTFSSPDTISIYNFTNGQMEFINNPTFLGYSQDKLATTIMIDQAHPEDKDRAAAFWQGLYSNQHTTISHIDYRLKHCEGHWEWVHNRAIILSRQPNGFAGRVLVIATIITERKQQELERDRIERLAIINEQLQELDQLKTKFMDDVSHELRTPAAAISLYLDLMEQSRADKRHDYLTTLKQNSRRLNELIESILQFSDLTDVAIMNEPSVVYLNDIVTDVIKQYLVEAQKAGLELIYSSETDLLLPVRGIADLLFRAIGYLLDNAIKYTPNGMVMVSLNLDDNKQMICVAIKDTGIGIEQDELEQVFERFYRGRYVSQLTLPGAGLGLSLARQIVTQHGGRIEIKSKPHAGTSVFVWLPLLQKPSQQAP